MTTRHRKADGTETTDANDQDNTEQQPPAGGIEAQASQEVEPNADRKVAIARELGAMADRLNQLQHKHYDVGVANALKAVEQARIALQPQAPIGPDGQPLPQQPPADAAAVVG